MNSAQLTQLGLALTLCSTAALCVAQTPAPSPADTPDARLVALDDADWTVRQRASEALMVEPAVTVAQLAEAYADPGRSAEARLRLGQVLRHRLIAEMIADFPPQPPEHAENAEPPQAWEAPPPPGPAEAQDPGWLAQVNQALRGAAERDAAALGIMHPETAVDPLPQRPGVEVFVIDTLPGFPAYPVLRPGDIIVRFANQPIPDAGGVAPSPIIRLIQQHRAGQTVPVHIVRDDRDLTVQVTLSSKHALAAVYTSVGGYLHLADAYQKRLEQRWLELTGQPLGANASASAAPRP